VPIQRCDRCKKSLVNGRCVNDKCPLQKQHTRQQERNKSMILSNPNYRRAFLENKLRHVRSAHGPDSEEVKELEAELAREKRYFG